MKKNSRIPPIGISPYGRRLITNKSIREDIRDYSRSFFFLSIISSQLDAYLVDFPRFDATKSARYEIWEASKNLRNRWLALQSLFDDITQVARGIVKLFSKEK